MKQTLLALSFIFLVTANSFSQQIIFSKVYYETNNIESKAACKSIDGGCIIVGNDLGEAFVFKIDTGGNVIWTNQYGTMGIEHFNCIIPTHDSCYVTAGTYYYMGIKMFLVKLNDIGDTLWTKVIDGNGSDVNSIQETYDHGFIVGGASNVVTKVDSMGNVEWATKYTGGNNMHILFECKQTLDSGYIATGYVESSPPFDPNAFIIKLSDSGIVEWSKRYNLTSQAVCIGYNILVTSDGYYAVMSEPNGLELMKLDSIGNIIWSKSFGVGNHGCLDCVYSKLYQSYDKSLIFTYGERYAGSELYKFDTTGSIVWSSSMFLAASDVVLADDSGFYEVGNGPLFGVRLSATIPYHIGVIKTDSMGSALSCTNSDVQSISNGNFISDTILFTSSSTGLHSSISPVTAHPTLNINNTCVDFVGEVPDRNEMEASIKIFPNPSNGIINISFLNLEENLELSIFSSIGQEVFSKTLSNSSEQTIDLDLPAGVYLVMLRGSKTSSIQKLIKE